MRTVISPNVGRRRLCAGAPTPTERTIRMGLLDGKVAGVTGAGSVITEDVPPGALGISRAEQKNIEGYAGKKAKESSEGKNS